MERFHEGILYQDQHKHYCLLVICLKDRRVEGSRFEQQRESRELADLSSSHSAHNRLYFP